MTTTAININIVEVRGEMKEAVRWKSNEYIERWKIISEKLIWIMRSWNVTDKLYIFVDMFGERPGWVDRQWSI